MRLSRLLVGATHSSSSIRCGRPPRRIAYSALAAGGGKIRIAIDARFVALQPHHPAVNEAPAMAGSRFAGQ